MIRMLVVLAALASAGCITVRCPEPPSKTWDGGTFK